MRLSLVLTHQCDLACAYCYTGEKTARSMPFEVGARAIERALAHDERLELGLFGGEPLLEWRLGARLIRHARSLGGEGVSVSLTTNGTHLSPNVLHEALDLGVQIAVSMDGLPEVHDAFRPKRGGARSSEAALAAIARLAAAGQAVRVVSVVRPETVDRLEASARFLVSRGVAAIVHALDESARWSRDEVASLRRGLRGLRRLYGEHYPRLEIAWLETKVHLLANPRLERPRCGVGQGEVAVAPSGRLYPCEKLVGEDAPGPYAFGHVDAEGPLDAATRIGTVASSCGDCASQPSCAHDCLCRNLARTGRPDAPDGLVCQLEQACAEEAAHFLRELATRRKRLPLVAAP